MNLSISTWLPGGTPKRFAAAAMLLMSITAEAQSLKTGIITDTKGEPLVGVSVVEQGTTNGTMTDANGRYSLTVKPGAKLKLTYVGFEPLTISPGRSAVMQEDRKTLDEVVVVGYGTMRRKDVTSSITTVSSKDLNQGVFTDPAQMLQGKVAGLVVSSTGDPTGTPSITLRGASSLRSGDAMQPYYVIDGIPGVDISMVAPDDIESIDVLRDASATAIYGSKAANGVIIITTKKGSKGRTSITYNGYVALSSVLKKLDMASAADLRASGLLVDDEGADVDWQDEVLRTGVSFNHNLSISGGNDDTKFMASLNYSDNDGVVRGTKMERANGRALVTTDALKKHLTLTAGVNAMTGTGHGVPVNANGESVLEAMNYYLPTNPIRNADGSWFDSEVGTHNFNPLSMINEDKSEFTWRRLQFISKAALKVGKDIVWNADYSYNTSQRTFSSYDSSQSQIVKGYNGQAHRSTASGNKHNFETYVNYNHDFGFHHLGIMLGYSYEQQMRNDGFGLTVHNFYDDTIGFHNLSYANLINGMSDVDGSVKETIRNKSYYGRVNYAYRGRYILQGTLRRDGSSVFGKNHRWGTFPSVSAAWNISEEPFMKNSFFDQLKLRAGYGVSGNALGFGAYTAVATYGLDTGSSFVYTSPDGATTTYYKLMATKNANPDLKWESTGMFNIGLDFAFFNSRLNGTIEFYSKKTWDLIWNYPVSTSIYPVSTLTANVGDISNKGVEFTLNATPVSRRDIVWTTSLNLSHNANKVTKLTKGRYSVKYVETADPLVSGMYANGSTERIMEGEPLGTFYTYEWAGRNSDGVSQYWVHDPVTNKRTGELTTSPVPTDKTKVGCAQPKLTYGWNNTLTLFSKLTLTAFFQGNLGNKIMNSTRAQFSCMSILSGGKNVLRETLQDPAFPNDPNYFIPSTYYLESGSYLRLATLSVAYTFNHLGGWLRSLQVYATAKNVFTITGYKGLDPEVELSGTEPGLDRRETFYPHTRSFMLGVKVNF